MTSPDLPPPSSPDTQEWNLARPDVRRSLILCAIGAIVGIGIAGFGLFTAQGTRTGGVPPEDAAVVNQVPLLMADFLQQLRATYSVGLAQATPQQKKTILDGMIREELYVQRGVELGMANDDIDVRAALVTATEAQTASDVMTTGATDAELQAYFDRRRGTYASEGRIELGDWLVPAGREQNAPAIVAKLRSGASPQSNGLVSSSKVDDGEEYYFAARIHLGAKLFDAAAKLRDGQVSEPVSDGGRVHILVVKHNVTPIPAVFASVRDHVLTDYIGERVTHVEQANARFLRKRADVKIAAALQ